MQLRAFPPIRARNAVATPHAAPASSESLATKFLSACMLCLRLRGCVRVSFFLTLFFDVCRCSRLLSVLGAAQRLRAHCAATPAALRAMQPLAILRRGAVSPCGIETRLSLSALVLFVQPPEWVLCSRKVPLGSNVAFQSAISRHFRSSRCCDDEGSVRATRTAAALPLPGCVSART